ncbi:response regulator transcription factor [Terrabacter sp. GCM10028922]|uniref:response regulator transcription factor n=1 Tax=Terrabacter sp. GCM10028922 TaxID=3273428 RepID=UPI0036102AFB
MPFHLAGWEHRAFVLARSGEDFPDEQVILARQLQPLLRLLDRHCRVLQLLPSEQRDAADLTGRELAVLVLLARGLTALAMAHQLAISERTVHKHLQRIYRKLGARDRVSAIYIAAARGLLSPVSRGCTVLRPGP